jgi:Protein of unknown function (DUF4241)
MMSLNSPAWRALQPGQQVIGDEVHTVVVADCGDLLLPSGHLVAADPFVTLTSWNRYYLVPIGAYPVRVTIDETIEREMYVSLILAANGEVEQRLLTPVQPNGEPCSELEVGSFYGIAVDAGTVCFVDNEVVERGMPVDESTWFDDLFENDRDDCWFYRMDDPAHIRTGLANIPLPGAGDGANIIICHSGWGDGFYPIVGGYDREGNLVAVHIDLLVHETE